MAKTSRLMIIISSTGQRRILDRNRVAAGQCDYNDCQQRIEALGAEQSLLFIVAEAGKISGRLCSQCLK